MRLNVSPARRRSNAPYGEIGDLSRSSDDGAPGGTAGRPALRAIENSGFDGVAVLVTRYYGGARHGKTPRGRKHTLPGVQNNPSHTHARLQ